MRYGFAIIALLLTLTITAQEQSPEEVNRFGIVEGFWFPELTCDLGVGWERIIFNWEQHQPNGTEDWFTLNVDDRWLKSANDCNREVVAILKHTPAWATDGLAGVGVPRGLYLSIDDPDNLWANFVRQTVEYYASRGITHYIIWNEPDIDSETYGYEFEGDLDDYFQLIKVADLVAQATDPATQIHLAGTTYWHDVNEGREPYMTRLIERIMQDEDAQANDYYFDVLSLHIYFRTDSVLDIVAEMREMLDMNGLEHKRIWINETNAAPTIDPVWQVNRPVFNLDLEHQANFLVQSTALALAGGVERIAVYKLYDQQLPEGAESFGILSPPDASPRPAFYTWDMITEHFADVEGTSLIRTETANVVRLTHRTQQETFVAWARTGSPTTIEVPLTGNKAYTLDLYGNITILRPSEGMYRLNLSPALCEDGEGCFLGGDVVILVQEMGANTITEIVNNTTNTFDF